MSDGSFHAEKHGWRLAVCLSHPIQYKVPLLRKLASHPRIAHLKAFFYSDTGLVERRDAYHGTTAKWDLPLLDGYEYQFLWDARFSKRRGTGYFNPSLVRHLLSDHWHGVMIHSYLYPNDWLAWAIGKLRSIPVLFYGEMYRRVYPNSARRRLAQMPKKLMLGGDTRCLAIGSMARRVFQELGVPPERIFLAPYAVDNGFFRAQAALWRPRQEELKTELGIPRDVPVVLCVAGMYPVKRQVDLVAALARLRKPAQLILVGRGPLFESVQAYCQKTLPGTILTGFKNQTELPRYYAAADLFVLPSLSETFGLVVNEAMCFGLPVITSDAVSASLDLIYPGENGAIFPPGDVKALAARLEPLLADSNLRHRWGERSRQIVSEWNYDKTVEGILAALEWEQQSRGSSRRMDLRSHREME